MQNIHIFQNYIIGKKCNPKDIGTFEGIFSCTGYVVHYAFRQTVANGDELMCWCADEWMWWCADLKIWRWTEFKNSIRGNLGIIVIASLPARSRFGKGRERRVECGEGDVAISCLKWANLKQEEFVLLSPRDGHACCPCQSRYTHRLAMTPGGQVKPVLELSS